MLSCRIESVANWKRPANWLILAIINNQRSSLADLGLEYFNYHFEVANRWDQREAPKWLGSSDKTEPGIRPDEFPITKRADNPVPLQCWHPEWEWHFEAAENWFDDLDWDFEAGDQHWHQEADGEFD